MSINRYMSSRGWGIAAIVALMPACHLIIGVDDVDVIDESADAGPPPGPDARDGDPSRASGAIVVYTFDEGPGAAVVRDSSGLVPPIDLTIVEPQSALWESGALRLIGDSTVATSMTPPTRLIQALQRSKAFTIEAWVHSDAPVWNGPRRIVTLSGGGDEQSFALAQGGSDDMTFADIYALRLRTSEFTHVRGTPALETEPKTATNQRVHIAYTRDEDGAVIGYRDGQMIFEGRRGGDLQLWEASHVLSVGNEPDGMRLFEGLIHLVAIYDRALDDREVESNFLAGPDAAPNP